MRAISIRSALLLTALLAVAGLSLSCGGDSGTPSPTPSNVVVTPGADTLISIGATRAFTASVLDANGDPIDGRTVTWSSTDSTIVRILPTGVATAMHNGAVHVIASAGGLQGEAPVTVAQVPATVTISPGTATFTFVGDTQTFTATILDGGGFPVVPVQKVWTLNDNTVAVIDSTGLARAKGPGVAMVTLVAIGPGGAKAAYAAVNSTQPVATLTFRTEPVDVEAGESMDPAVQAEVRDSGGAVVSGYSGAVTVSVDSGPPGAVLHGTKTVNAVNGVVSYSGLWLDKAGEYRFRATATGLTPAASLLFQVQHSAPYQARILMGPDDDSLPLMIAGQVLPLTAELEDRFGNLTFDSLTPVQVELVAAPDSGTVVGILESSHEGNGVRSFPLASIVRAGVGYRIRVIGPSILPDSTRPFEVVAAAAARLVLLNDPLISAGFPTWNGDSIEFTVVDAFDNRAFVEVPTVVSVAPFGWPYAASEGRGQGVMPGSGTEIVGGGPFWLPLFGFTRPGPAGFVLQGAGLLPDTAAVTFRHFLLTGDVVAGGNTTCLAAQAFLYCAGSNASGMMGVDPAVLTSDSVPIGPDTPVGGQYQVVLGGGFLCRRPGFGAGTIACRGANDEGQLGTAGGASFDFQNVPGVIGAWQLTAGDAHACALLADSTAVCWGRNDHGQLGRGTTSAFEAVPAAVLGGLKWKVISAGFGHTCGVTAGGAAYCWGANESGQLGDSTQTERTQPTALFGGGMWRDIAAGGHFSCGQKHNGFVFAVDCWGDNSLGQVGVAAGGVKLIPTVPNFVPNNEPGSLAVGSAHACVTIEGLVRCWGDNSRGAVGTGSIGGIVDVPTLVQLPFPGFGGVVTAGSAHTCTTGVGIPGLELFEVKFTYCWGANDSGQLGNGTTTDSGVAVEVVR
ncbi:MAG: hypothetical protein JF590_02755 [Gemmatimonadetes bacterium]|nr:hypothetical protein [Gemmatimonadota bacterium]